MQIYDYTSFIEDKQRKHEWRKLYISRREFSFIFNIAVVTFK